MLGNRGGLAGLAPRPAPYLLGALPVGEDDQVLKRRLGDLGLDFLSRGAIRNLLPGWRLTNPGNHSALFGDSSERERRARDFDRQLRIVPIPPQLLDEELSKVETCQKLPCVTGVEVHSRSPLSCRPTR